MSQSLKHAVNRRQRLDALGQRGFTPRVWLMILVLVPLICYWVFLTEEVFVGADLVSSSLMVAAVFLLCLLLILNALLSIPKQRALVLAVFALGVTLILYELAPPVLPWPADALLLVVLSWFCFGAYRRAAVGRAWEPFSRSELLVMYVAVTVSAWFSSMGGMQFLISSMTSPFFYADSSNGWGDLARLIPRWISVRNPAVVGPLFHGQTSWLQPAILRAWAVPIACWSLFVLLVFGFAVGLNMLLRKQWIEYERLAFPIAQFPLEVTVEGHRNPLFRNSLFWLGALLAVGLELVNGLHQFFPTVPLIPILPTEMSGFFTSSPWNGIGSIPVAFYPWIIGLVYFVPLDVSFSSWFFFLVSRFSGVVTVAIGMRTADSSDLNAPPYQMDQGFGAFVGIALLSLWMARRHLAGQVRAALGRSDPAGPPGEARAALGTLILCGLGLLVWFRLTSGSWWVMAAWFAVYAIIVLAASRMRAEAGPGWVWAPRWPWDLFWFSLGNNAFTPQEQAAMTAHTWIAQDVRHTTFAAQMEGFKIGESAGLPAGWLAAAMGLAMLMALAGSWWAGLSVTYRYGYATANMHQWRLAQGRDLWGWLHSWINGGGQQPNMGIVAAWIAGCAIVLFLGWMRQNILWWPFHPVGYAIGNTFSMTWLWTPTLIACGAKALILRYGGSGAYRRGIPFATGLILGDFSITGVYALISTFTHVTMYKTFPVP